MMLLRQSAHQHLFTHAQCVLEFPLACGITVGTPVRIRGVPVGSVLAVHPSLERVEVLAEVRRAAPQRVTRYASQTCSPLQLL